ncbi:glycosyltransferase family 2 protein [Hwanghaeella sp.]|uniref:glycosyltransferase family 2 protein n=1 Tax=Hwanghaeella sp. TaxID=2605943 RepID=UPI003CCBD1D3
MTHSLEVRSATDRRVSVVLPFKNGARTLARAISSILENEEVGELILVNDQSTDGFQRVIDSFDDPRILLLDNEGSGIADGFNTGLKRARCEFIAKCDDDDLYVAGRFIHQVRALDSSPDIVAVGGQHLVCLDDGTEIGKLPLYDEARNISESLCEGVPEVYFTTCLVRRDVLLKMGGKRNYFYVAEDLDTLFRLGMEGEVLYLPGVVYIHHLRKESISHRTRRSRHKFFNAKAKEFAEQRKQFGKDDLQVGKAEKWEDDREVSEDSSEYLNNRIIGILTANAFYNLNGGRNRLALAQIARALTMNITVLATWRSACVIVVRVVLPRARSPKN